MNKQTEALKMAIKAMIDANDIIVNEWSWEHDESIKAIQACKEALEQPAQSACEKCIGFNKKLAAENDELKRQNDALRYKLSEPWKPLQRAQEPVQVIASKTSTWGNVNLSWQGLSDDEIKDCEKQWDDSDDYSNMGFARAIEQALKEKNT